MVWFDIDEYAYDDGRPHAKHAKLILYHFVDDEVSKDKFITTHSLTVIDRRMNSLTKAEPHPGNLPTF